MRKRIVSLLNCFIAKTKANNNVTMKQCINGRGFTLIELLIVIAVLGILITGILIVLNPVEQTRRASDSQRTSAISQLATAVTTWQTSQLKQDFKGLEVAAWQTVLQNAQEIKNVISVPPPIIDCTSTRKEPTTPTGVGVCNCTTSSGTSCNRSAAGGPDTHQNIAIWVFLDSTAEKTRAGCAAADKVIVAYVSTQQKTGVGCVKDANSDSIYDAAAEAVVDAGGTTGSIFNISLK